jgi:hypothetical protein
VRQTGSAPWTIGTAQGGAYTLRYPAGGKMLDVNGSSTTAGLAPAVNRLAPILRTGQH